MINYSIYSSEQQNVALAVVWAALEEEPYEDDDQTPGYIRGML